MAKKRGTPTSTNVFDNLDSKSNTEVLSKISELVQLIEQKTGKDFSDILSQTKKKEQIQKDFFPLSILTRKLGVAETLVRYLKDWQHLNYRNISNIMHRSEGVVGVMYRTSLKKYPSQLKPSLPFSQDILVPLSLFSETYTAFESIIIYLKEKESLKFSQIARLTSRDQRTIWTIYNRTRNRSNSQNSPKTKGA